MQGMRWALVLRVLNAVALLVINMLLTRIMSPEDVGLYFLVMSMVMMLTYLGSFGLHLAVVRLVAEALGKQLPGRARQIVRKVFFLSGANVIVFGAASLFGGLAFINNEYYHSEGVERNIPLIVGWVVAWSMQMNFAEILRGLDDIKSAVFFRKTASSLPILGFLVFLALSSGSTTFENVLVGVVGCWTASSLLAALVMVRKVARLKGEGEVGYREIVALSLPLGITSLFTLGMEQADIWILGTTGQMDDVAVYGAVVRLLRQVLFPLFIITATIQPVIARLHAQERIQQLERILRGTATAAMLMGVMMFVWVCILGKWTLITLFGEHYGAGESILIILAVGTMFRMIDGTNWMALMMMRGERVTMMLSIAYTVAVIVLGIVVVPVYGPIGMAWVMAGTSAIRCLLHALFIYFRTGMVPLPTFDPRVIWELVAIRSGQRHSQSE